jgi:DNA-3-methyladenine glycosylase I
MDSKSYCASTAKLPKENLHKIYHETQYGFPINSDNELFGRLILEINQAGLSWTTILKKQDFFRAAYANFDIKTIASFSEEDRNRLLNDAGIIRNKLKVKAAIHNAQVILTLQEEYGSFKAWILGQGSMPLEDWVKLFRKHFKFTGPEIVNEFLMSCGFIQGAHQPDCPYYTICQKAIAEAYKI